MDALSNEEIENCRIAFNKFDKDMSGSISDWELRAMLNCTRHHTCIHIYTYACSCPLLIFLNQWRALVCRTCAPSLADTPAVVSFCCAAMGQDPSDEDLFDMIAAVDEDGSGEIGKNRSSPAEDGARASIILVATCLNDHARACLPRTETKAFTTHAHIPSRLGSLL